MIKNNKLKEINLKNHTCYYFDNIISINYMGLDNILIDKESHENI